MTAPPDSSHGRPAASVPLVPRPRFAAILPGSARLAAGTAVVAPDVPGVAPVVRRLADRLGAALGGAVAVHHPRHDRRWAARRPGRPVDVQLVLDSGRRAAEPPDDPSTPVDESFSITVDDHGVVLSAATPAGLRHASTTLLTLVERPESRGRPRPVDLPAMRVEDGPVFAWRGLMLDVARHFLDVPTVLAVLEVMADLKLNRLHLHLSDDQGWRVQLASRPRLTEASGSTAVNGDPGGFYTAADLRRIVHAAADLGIVVVPEIDTPGHVNAATHAYGELVPGGVPTDAYTGIDVGFSRLHADLPGTAPFVGDVLGEVAGLVDGPWVHVGGDEALTLEREEYVRLVRLALDAVADAGRAAVAWQEVARADPPPGTVLQLWDEREGAEEVVEAARRGARVLLSPASRTYLDLKYDADFPLGLEWAGHLPLRQAYEWNPLDALDLPDGSLLGVEACLWTETVRSRDDLAALLLPRLAAVAEVAWSPASSRDWAGFRTRLAAFAPRWTAAGLAWTRTPDVAW
ncbi:MAG: beta-N-acetylhexosaminidase [Actinomycetales bacterium]|nr:beta-N-acetylhexosaminidase [Actinomycetales bacterium]